MSFATQHRDVTELQAEYDAAQADLRRLLDRIEAGTADPAAVTLAQYRLHRAATALAAVSGDAA